MHVGPLEPTPIEAHHARMTYMTDAKWVRIMCDYAADPVWGPDGAMNDLDDLPVTAELKAALWAWEEEYDVHSPGEDEPPLDRADFSNRGRDLAREVKRQLPDWTVVYFDEEASANRPDDAPRSLFEYPIEL